jgi:hypothetical protein
MELKIEYSEDEIRFILMRERKKSSSKCDPLWGTQDGDFPTLSFHGGNGDAIFVHSCDICDGNEYDLNKYAVLHLRDFLDDWLKRHV